ncbi:MAG TPA: hypothetical protein VF457_17275 [Burkholderiaceae bacterium]
MCPALAKQMLSPDAGAALRDRARLLRMSMIDLDAVPLRGRHVAIASAAHDMPSARLFERAAVSLGARVSHIGAEALTLEPRRRAIAARVLGSLYDAVDFIPLPPRQADALQDAAGVPVFADLAGGDSPLCALLSAPEGSAEREDELLALVQAVLVQAIG